MAPPLQSFSTLLPHSVMTTPTLTPHLLFTIAAFVVPILALIVTLKTKSSKKGQLKLPPGPPGWPIVGNLLQVARSGKSFIHYVVDIRAIYGPIFTLRMGARTLIFISSPELAHEALIEKGQLFASRPPENPTRTIFSCDKFTVNSALYGPEWRSLRRNMVSGMLSNARLREYRPARESAMSRFIQRIRAEAEASNGTVAVLKNARFAVFCILLSMCYGVELDEETIVEIDRVMKLVLMTLMPRMDDYLPLLAPLFSKQRREALRVRQLQIDSIVPLIEQRKSILLDPKAHPSALPFSYLDSLLELNVEGRGAPSYPELVTLCSEFINGGTDTTATAIEWALARLIENPAMQERIYKEIDAVCSHNNNRRPVEEKDTEGMVYLQAFVKELLRKHPPTYFSLTHAAVEDGVLGGYRIPKGVNLEIYLPSIAEDPRLWRKPTEFEPERFLSGGEVADLTGVSGIRMIPFGAGRRVCPGLGMGMTHITLMVARMVQAFEWRAHPDQPPLDFGDKLEFTVVMRTPLVALVKARE